MLLVKSLTRLFMLVTTKKQENLALQDFADNHTKTRRQMHEFSGQLFSVHIKLKNSTQVIPYNTADSVSIASDSDKVFISDGADIKVLTKESEISFGTKTANVINVARFTSFFDNGRYQNDLGQSEFVDQVMQENKVNGGNIESIETKDKPVSFI